MKQVLFFILSLLLSPLVDAQSIIRGYVKDATNNENIEFATVYVNGTTIGTNTDFDGYFELKIPSFPVQVVASHLSYKNVTFLLEQPQKDTLLVRLEPDNFDLATVQVTDNNNRLKNLREFKENFLGIDPLGKEAILQNPEVLLFNRTYDTIQSRNVRLNQDGNPITIKRSKEMTAKGRKTLMVDLPSLGYKVNIDLVHFGIEYGRGLGEPDFSNWLVYTYFQPYESNKKSKLKRWAKNREKAFIHSQQHFFRALYDKELAENGYKLFIKVKDTINQRATFEPFNIYDYATFTDNNMIQIEGLKDQEIEVFYYAKYNGFPLNVSKKKGNNPIRSFMRFKQDVCQVRADGTTPYFSIIIGGSLAQKKMGASLPEDYIPMGDSKR